MVGRKKTNRVREAAKVQPNLKLGTAHFRPSIHQEYHDTFIPNVNDKHRYMPTNC